MQKKSLGLQSLLSVLAAGVYIFLVSIFMTYGEEIFGPGPDNTILGPISVLLLFVLSAAIMGVLFFAKPVMLYLDGKKKDAVAMVGLNILWTFILTVIFLALNIVF